MVSHNERCCAPTYFNDVKIALKHDGPQTFTELSATIGILRAKANQGHCPDRLRETLYYLRDKGEITDPDRNWKWHLAETT